MLPSRKSQQTLSSAYRASCPRFIEERSRQWPSMVFAALLAGAVGIAACSSPVVESVAPDHDSMVDGFVELGLTESVADCVVGWTERFELDPVIPTEERDPADQLVIDEAIENCTTADALVNPPLLEPERLAFDNTPFTLGDDFELDILWGKCEVGNGQACDELWERAPVGSEYESFGVTCGQRFEVLNCSEELKLGE